MADTLETACSACRHARTRPVFDKIYEGKNLAHAGINRITLEFRRCGDCGVVFAVPLSEAATKAAEAWYEAVYGEAAQQGQPHQHPVNQARYQEWLRLFEPYRRTGRLFETGFGRGEFLRCALGAGWRCAGNEMAQAACEIAARAGVETHCGDLNRVAAGGEYDVVVSLGVIEHVKDPLAQFRHYARLLRPGGLMFLTTPNVNSLSRWVLGPDCTIFDFEHLFYYSPASMRRALRQARLRVLGCWTKNLNVPAVLNRLRGAKEDRDAVAEAQQQLRARLEFNPVLRTVKDLANAGVRVLGIGEELYAMAVKEDTSDGHETSLAKNR